MLLCIVCFLTRFVQFFVVCSFVCCVTLFCVVRCSLFVALYVFMCLCGVYVYVCGHVSMFLCVCAPVPVSVFCPFLSDGHL